MYVLSCAECSSQSRSLLCTLYSLLLSTLYSYSLLVPFYSFLYLLHGLLAATFFAPYSLLCILYSALYLLQVLFAVTFIGTRVVGYGFGLLDLWLSFELWKPAAWGLRART